MSELLEFMHRLLIFLLTTLGCMVLGLIIMAIVYVIYEAVKQVKDSEEE